MVLMVKYINRFTRELTIEEKCMVHISENCSYKKEFREEVKEHLKEIGYISFYYVGCYSNGNFEIEETRIATMNEAKAYYYLKLESPFGQSCAYPNKRVCHTCCFSGRCPLTPEKNEIAEKTIEGLTFFESEDE